MIRSKRSIFINGLIVLAAGLACFRFLPHSGNREWNPAFKIVMNCAGFSIALLGQFLRISARGYKSQRSRRGVRLITDGPYRLTRNPMYLGSFLIGLGMFMILFPWWTLPGYCLFFLGWYAFQIRGEQQRLVEKLGTPYRDYCRRVPVFFPRFAGLFKCDLSRTLPFHFSWVKREWKTLGGWVGVAFLHEGVLSVSGSSFRLLWLEMAAFLLITIFALVMLRGRGLSSRAA